MTHKYIQLVHAFVAEQITQVLYTIYISIKNYSSAVETVHGRSSMYAIMYF